MPTANQHEKEAPAIIRVWTTENSEAIVWGTHDLAAAKKAYAAENYDTEPDWNAVRLMWAAPHLADIEGWNPSDYGDAPKDGWIPFAVYEL